MRCETQPRKLPIEPTPSERLRGLLAEPDLILAPGCYDALSARLLETAGHRCAYLSGSCVSAADLGRPDLGFAGLRDMSSRAAVVAAAVKVPLIADADTGYGNPMHVAYAAETYERAGVAAIQLEDQVAPKRCGHFSGKAVISIAEMEQKLRAAADACRVMLIVARTDAFALDGIDEVCARATAYAHSGADLLFAEGVQDADLLAVSEAACGLPLLINLTEAAGELHLPSRRILRDANVKVVIRPTVAILAAAAATLAAYTRVLTEPSASADRPMTWAALNEVLGLPEHVRAEQRYATDNPEAQEVRTA